MTITVNIHEAKTHLSRLLEQAVQGHDVIIAKAGKPMVRVVAVEPLPQKRRLGFMSGQARIDVDVKAAFAEDIEGMFAGGR